MSVLLVVQIIIVVCMIAVILLQKSSSDGFTGASSSTGLMSGRASANLLTRITSFLAAAFIINSLVLAYLSSHAEKAESIVGGSEPVKAEQAAPAMPAVPEEGKAATPEKAPEPAVPDELPAKGKAAAKPKSKTPAPEVPVEQ